LHDISNGCVNCFNRFEDGEIKFNFNTNCLRDLFFVGFDLNNQITDGTESLLTFEIEFFEPGIMDSRTDDKALITISDDLSGLSGLRVALIGKEEIVD